LGAKRNKKEKNIIAFERKEEKGNQTAPGGKGRFGAGKSTGALLKRGWARAKDEQPLRESHK